MSVQLIETEPGAIHQDVVSYWLERGQWPSLDKDQYHALWAWRYTKLSDGPAQVCVARETTSGEVIGHVAIYRRRFALNGRLLRVGVPGSLALRDEHQGGLAGAKLANFPRQRLRVGDYDAILGFSNILANEFLTRTGAKPLGQPAYHVDLRRSHKTLAHRGAVAGALALPVDLGLSLRRVWRTRSVGSAGRGLAVRELTGDQFRALDRSEWVAPRDRVVSADSTEFVVSRFLECPYATRRMYGLFDRGTDRLQAYAVTEGNERIDVWTCQTNAARLDVPAALVAFGDAFDGAEAITATTSRDSMASQDLARAGFVLRPAEKSPNPERRLNMTLATNSRSDQLEDFSRWDIWLGASQY
jgi:hypothetical protein